METLAYRLYLLFTVSFFLHLAARIPLLGTIRFDLLNIALITILLVTTATSAADKSKLDKTTKILFLLLGYVIVTVPFVTWPGSVLRHGFSDWIKAAIFYFFTAQTLTTERRLRTFILIFMGCQLFRVAEPVYLHIFHGYWGLHTNMAGQYMLRLSGAPLDVINSNGLAEVIATVFLFLHYSASGGRFRYKALYICSLPMLVYALVLTGSRSGMIAMGIGVAGIIFFSKRKVLGILFVAITATAIFVHLPSLLQDRYLSTVADNVPGSVTARGRIEGWKTAFFIGLERPIFGHGIGTSPEAEFHATGFARPSHNLYTQVFIDLGLLGLIIWLAYLTSVTKNFVKARRKIVELTGRASYLARLAIAMQVWVVMMLIFSLASYGLVSYEWYLFGGLSVVLSRLADRVRNEEGEVSRQGLREPKMRGRLAEAGAEHCSG